MSNGQEITSNNRQAELISRYGVWNINRIVQDEDNCIFGQHLQLDELSSVYGAENVAMVITGHISALNEYAGATGGKMFISTMAELAQSILNNRKFLKITEVILYLYRVRNGKHVTFFGGRIDPIAIQKGFDDFILWRDRKVIERQKKEEREQDGDDERHGVMLEDYLSRHEPQGGMRGLYYGNVKEIYGNEYANAAMKAAIEENEMRYGKFCNKEFWLNLM